MSRSTASEPASSQPGSSQPAASQPASTQPAKIGPLFANVETNKGNIRIELFPAKAPVTVTNFCNLVNRGFYNGTTWFEISRVVRMAGSPDGTQTYRPGYTIKRELNPTLKFDGPGDVAMVKNLDSSDSPSHGSQFFITIKEQDRWTLDFAIFGSVVEGQRVVDSIEKGDQIIRIAIDGDPAPLFKKYAKLVESWNKALDAGAPRDPSENTTPGSPLLRKPPQ
jgi:peptidyl-prolyl cis-trans isomerase B (cyclophilin B)